MIEVESLSKRYGTKLAKWLPNASHSTVIFPA